MMSISLWVLVRRGFWYGVGFWWRLGSSVLSQLRGDFQYRLQPLQLGVGVPRGPEIMSQVVRIGLESHSD